MKRKILVAYDGSELSWKAIREAELQANTVADAEVVIDHMQRNAGRAIAEYADQQGIDLILIGSRGLGGVKGTVLGSVSSQVVQHARCHVLVVK